MTGAELASAVDRYFETHLDAGFWGGLASASKTGALTMACNDVLGELPGVVLDDLSETEYAVKAIAEQAVFLARNYESMNEGKVLTSESVEGLSEGYTLISSKVGLSFRAEAFIKRAKSAFFGGSVRVTRG